jgi:iron(III) transport system substrate-binding protein
MVGDALRTAFMSAVLLAAAAGCGKPSVTVYASADQDVAQPVFDRFERETGIHVDAKFDTEATKTTGLANTLRAERSRPRADVFWSNEQAANVALAAEQVTEPFRVAGASGAASAAASVADAWPSQWRDRDGRWYAFAGRARVIVYAPDRVALPPETWTQLVAPRWRGKIAMADPRFGTTRSHLGAMKAYWDIHAMPGYYEAFAEGLAENLPRILTSGNAGVIDAVARGEADIGLTDTDDVFAAQARGLKLAMVFPRHARDPGTVGGGTFAIPNTVAVVAGCPHPEAARRFVEFMLAPETERELAKMAAHHAPLVTGPEAGDLQIPDPLMVDAGQMAASADAAVNAFLASVKDVGTTAAVVRPTADTPASDESSKDKAAGEQK